MGMPGPSELLIIAIVILVLFGAKKLPEASRSLGRSMRIFKSETKGLHDDDDSKNKKPSEQHTTAEPQRLSSSEDQPVMNGKIVDPDEAAHRQSR